MAKYVQPNIEVSISENCFESAHYVHFGRFITGSDSKDKKVTKIVFTDGKRYIIDSRKVNNLFDRLPYESYYLKSDLHLDVVDSYIGSKASSVIETEDGLNDNTITSIIYPNEFFDTDNRYCFAFVTGKNTTHIPDIEIPYTYQYPIDNINDNINLIKLVTKLVQNYDNTKWLYLIDCQQITNKWCSYIIHFYSETNNNDSISNVTIKLHTINEEAHIADLARFANEIATQRSYSYFMLNNCMNTTFSKVTGLLTANPMQHRLQFFGTPYGYSFDKLETIVKDQLLRFTDKTSEDNYLNKLIDYVDKRKRGYFLINDTDRWNTESDIGNNSIDNKLFGNNQLNYVSYDMKDYYNKLDKKLNNIESEEDEEL